MRSLLFIICVLTVLTACRHEDDNDEKIERTVLVYMSGENDLDNTSNEFLFRDLNQIREGSKLLPSASRLIVYVDNARRDVKPYLLDLRGGQTRDSIPMALDLQSADPATLVNVMEQVMEKYPADEYGLVLWGHASGWLIEDSVASSVWTTPLRVPRKAYGRETGNNSTSTTAGKWMNIPSLARGLAMLPKLKFIFADCCHFQCVEVAYELRKVTDYIIGSPAEIPGEGAPYHTVVPALFEKETFAQSVVDRYYEQVLPDVFRVSTQTPLSVVKTSEMENLAAATYRVLNTFVPDSLAGYPDMRGIIHYYYNGSMYKFYDMNNFFLKYAPAEAYAEWKAAFDRAVIYSKMSKRWMTNMTWGYYYTDFEVTAEAFGGVSMFVPQYYGTYTTNTDIRKMGWYYAAKLSDFGW